MKLVLALLILLLMFQASVYGESIQVNCVMFLEGGRLDLFPGLKAGGSGSAEENHAAAPDLLGEIVKQILLSEQCGIIRMIEGPEDRVVQVSV